MGTREAIHQALCAGWLTNRESGFIEYTKYLCRINKSGCSDSTGAVANQVETGYVLAAISKQRQIVQAYLRYAYGLEERSEALRTILGWGIRWSIEPKPSTAHRHARLMALAKVSTDDYRLRVAQTRSMPIEVYGQAMQVNIKSWSRDWRDLQNKALDYLAALDHEGVANVSIMVKALRGKSELSITEALETCGKNNAELRSPLKVKRLKGRDMKKVYINHLVT